MERETGLEKPKRYRGRGREEDRRRRGRGDGACRQAKRVVWELGVGVGFAWLGRSKPRMPFSRREESKRGKVESCSGRERMEWARWCRQMSGWMFRFRREIDCRIRKAVKRGRRARREGSEAWGMWRGELGCKLKVMWEGRRGEGGVGVTDGGRSHVMISAI